MGKPAGKIALGLGLITGAVAGLLFAPEEGKKIRKKIAKGDTKGLLKDLETMGNEIKEMAADFANKPSVLEAVDKAKDKAADVVEMQREELDELLEAANKKAEDFKKTAARYVKEQKALLDQKYKEMSKKTKNKGKKGGGKTRKKSTKKSQKKSTGKKKSDNSK